MSKIYLMGNDIDITKIKERLKQAISVEVEIEKIHSYELFENAEMILLIFELARDLVYSVNFDIIKYTLKNILKQIKANQLDIQYIKVVNEDNSVLIETNMILSEDQQEKLIDSAISGLSKANEHLDCYKHMDANIDKVREASENLISVFQHHEYKLKNNITAKEEARERIKYFKHIIEDCDGYKSLYVDGKQIATEKDLQRLFKFVWYGTSYKVDEESNNGRGQADFIVSKGNYDQNIIEFKLASNPTLEHVFTQVKIYEAANCTDGSIIVIFFFSKGEYEFSKRIIENSGYINYLDESIYLIDCRKDNKTTASKA